uniref:Uncharacterized protein n=1 Tax=Parascaris equorum TaxID=6256 RepID=A0A914R8E3_PAREQ
LVRVCIFSPVSRLVQFRIVVVFEKPSTVGSRELKKKTKLEISTGLATACSNTARSVWSLVFTSLMSTLSLRTNGDDESDREQLTIGDCEICDTTSKYSVGALLSGAANATSSKISRASINLRSLLSGSTTKKTNDDDVSTSESEIAIGSSVRQKFDSVWFSLVYGRWRISRSEYKKRAPLWLLGEFYFTNRPDNDDEVVFRAFAIDYYSHWRFWGDEEANRYRCGFGHYDIVSLFGDHLYADLGLYRLMKIAKERNEHGAVGNWYSACTAFGLISP